MKANCFSQFSGESFTFKYDNRTLKMEEALSRYVQLKSLSGNELAAGEFLKKLCLDNGLDVFQMGNTNGNYNFSASIKPLHENLPNIIFLNHIDVVPSGDMSKWKFPPYSGKIINDELWGRGSYDNKGAALMQLAGIIEVKRRLQNENIPYNVTLLAVSCEETQCSGGVNYVIDNYLEELNPTIIVGEGPSELAPILKKELNNKVFGISVAHKRALWLKLELEIKTTGHGSITPIEYANKEMVASLNNLLQKKQKAIYSDLNVDLLKQLSQLEKGFSATVLKHPRFFKFLIVPKLRKQPEMFALFSNTITLTSIDSHNDVINVVPDKVTVMLDCRLLPEESEEEFLKELKQRLSNDSIKVSIVTSMPKMRALKDNNELYQNFKTTLEETFIDSKVLKVFIPNFNDVGVFRSHGIDGISITPVKIERKYLETIHSYNERIPIRILEEGKDIYTHFIMKSLGVVNF